MKIFNHLISSVKRLFWWCKMILHSNLTSRSCQVSQRTLLSHSKTLLLARFRPRDAFHLPSLQAKEYILHRKKDSFRVKWRVKVVGRWIWVCSRCCKKRVKLCKWHWLRSPRNHWGKQRYRIIMLWLVVAILSINPVNAKRQRELVGRISAWYRV